MCKHVTAVIILFFLLVPVRTEAENLLNGPNGIVYDTVNNRYLVSNAKDGYIVQVDSFGQHEYFDTRLELTTGLLIIGDTLYACSNEGIYAGLSGFDLETGDMLFNFYVPNQVHLKNLAADTSGYVYITDYDGNDIHRVNLQTHASEVFVSSGLSDPAGIIFDAPNNRMLFVNENAAGHPVCAMNLEDRSISTMVNVGFPDIDGIAQDTSGNWYVSCWSTGCVYKYDPDFVEPRVSWSCGHSGPDNVCYNPETLEMAVVNYYIDTLRYVPNPYDRDSDTDGLRDAYDNCPFAYNPGQEDEDNDEAGDPCDNCLGLYNPGQEDVNQNGIGDDCETNRCWYVAQDGSGDAMTIQDGIDFSTHGDTVVVADGTYTGTGENVFDFGGRRIVFRSVNGPQNTIIDCQGSAAEPRRACTLEADTDSTMVIDGFTIRNGYGPQVDGAATGGGMMIKYASATVRNCIFTDNYAVLGGAVFVREANPRFINCTFAGNTGSYGAALAASFYGQCILENCIVAFNGPGAAVYCYGSGSADLFCCDVYGNTGGDWTGCLYGQETSEGNFSTDPGFCNLAIGDVGLHDESSPCIAANTSCGVLVGACDIGCSCYCGYHCDVNLDGDINPVDVVFMVNFVYKSLDGREQYPACAGNNGDWNCDTQVNPVDVVYYVNFVYKSVEAGPCDPCAGG